MLVIKALMVFATVAIIMTNFLVVSSHLPRIFILHRQAVYVYFANFLNFAQAAKACTQVGGQLASITNSYEQGMAVKTLPKNMGSSVWVGGSDQKQEGHWVWRDGSKFAFTAWGKHYNEPNGGRRENCLQLQRKKTGLLTEGFWNDKSCSVSSPFICEFN